MNPCWESWMYNWKYIFCSPIMGNTPLKGFCLRNTSLAVKIKLYIPNPVIKILTFHSNGVSVQNFDSTQAPKPHNLINQISSGIPFFWLFLCKSYYKPSVSSLIPTKRNTFDESIMCNLQTFEIQKIISIS